MRLAPWQELWHRQVPCSMKWSYRGAVRRLRGSDTQYKGFSLPLAPLPMDSKYPEAGGQGAWKIVSWDAEQAGDCQEMIWEQTGHILQFRDAGLRMTRKTGSHTGASARCLFLGQSHRGHPAALLKAIKRKGSWKKNMGRVPCPAESSDSWLFPATEAITRDCHEAESPRLIPQVDPPPQSQQQDPLCSLVVLTLQTVFISLLVRAKGSWKEALLSLALLNLV